MRSNTPFPGDSHQPTRMPAEFGFEDPAAHPAYSVIPSTPSLHRYLIFLGKKWYLVLLPLMFFGALAAGYIAYWPESYVSMAHLWAAGKIGLQLHEGATYSEEGQTFAGTQVELLQSDKVMERAFARTLRVPGVIIPTNSQGKPKFVSIKVSQLPKSAVLELKARGPTDNYTRAFLDAVMDEFLAYKREVRAATSGDTYTSVSEQITKQEADLKAAQDKLTTYQRDNNVAVLEEQAKAASTYLTQLLAEFSQLKVEYQLLEAMSPESQWTVTSLSNTLAGAADPRKLTDSGLPSTAPSPDFLNAQQELEKIRIVRARLSKYLRPEHPKIIKLDEEISRAEKFVDFFSQQSRDQLAKAKQAAKLKIDRVQETIKEWEAKVNNASMRIAEYERMKLDVERLQGLNDRLLSLLQTVDVTRNLDQENITILDRASETKSGKLPLPLTLALALFMGLGTGFVLVFLAENTDDRLLSLDELATRFEEWVIGQVPEVPRAKKKKQPPLLDVNDNRHMFAESYRNLRSALLFLPMPGEPPKVLLITSAIPGEGKSTIATNLARALAFGGSRVLLVDCDLRKGALNALLELEPEPGLSDLLSNGVGNPDKFIKPIPLSGNNSQLSIHGSGIDSCHQAPGLYFLSRGCGLNNPGDHFLSRHLDATLLHWRQQFDYIIIDSCPVFASDDATTLAPKVDGTLFVVRSRFTRARTVHKALELLYQRQAKVLGLVFNRTHSRSRDYEYYKYKDYYQAVKPAAEI
jgi:Mrp family chromosome partitioning ATPase/uncharacterized protein involved in exopolysaccharide biosynthesis